MYKINLSNFSGPIDLLIYLVKKEEVDIFSFNIMDILDDYIEYVRLMQILNIDGIIEFFYFISVLLNIKSKKLLPKEEIEEQIEELNEEELRLLMQERLEEYKKYKEVAVVLAKSEENMNKIFIRNFSESQKEKEIELHDLSLFDLLTCFKEILNRAKKEIIEIEPEKVTIEDKIRYLQEKLNNNPYGVRFFELFTENVTRIEIIVTFLAILELIRLKKIRVIQKRAFDEIYIYR